jgi:hypothetical protein
MSEMEATPKPLPPVGSYVYLSWVQLCHMRLAALYRIAGGREEPDDAKLVTGCESLLALHGWVPRDFGFVDTPEFDRVRMRIVDAARELAPIDCASPELRARAAWKIPAGKRVVY